MPGIAVGGETVGVGRWRGVPLTAGYLLRRESLWSVLKRQVIVKITTVGGDGTTLLVAVAGEVADPPDADSLYEAISAADPSRSLRRRSGSVRRRDPDVGRHQRPAQDEGRGVGTWVVRCASSRHHRSFVESSTSPTSPGTSGSRRDSSNHTSLPLPVGSLPQLSASSLTSQQASSIDACRWGTADDGGFVGGVGDLDPDVRRGDVGAEGEGGSSVADHVGCQLAHQQRSQGSGLIGNVVEEVDETVSGLGDGGHLGFELGWWQRALGLIGCHGGAPRLRLSDDVSGWRQPAAPLYVYPLERAAQTPFTARHRLFSQPPNLRNVPTAAPCLPVRTNS